VLSGVFGPPVTIGSATTIIILSSADRRNVSLGTNALFAGNQGMSGSSIPNGIIFAKKPNSQRGQVAMKFPSSYTTTAGLALLFCAGFSASVADVWKRD